MMLKCKSSIYNDRCFCCLTDSKLGMSVPLLSISTDQLGRFASDALDEIINTADIPTLRKRLMDTFTKVSRSLARLDQEWVTAIRQFVVEQRAIWVRLTSLAGVPPEGSLNVKVMEPLIKLSFVMQLTDSGGSHSHTLICGYKKISHM
jgi:hypothetical protein